jgi:succinate-acetate transporter protein
MSRDHYLLLCDFTADKENTVSSIVACWTVFTELLPGNALIKPVTILLIAALWTSLLFLAYKIAAIITDYSTKCTIQFLLP